MAQKDFLKGLTKEQIAQLGLSPEVTSQLEGLQDVSMQPAKEFLPPPAYGSFAQGKGAAPMEGGATVADQNLMMAQEEPVAFQAMNSALTESGLQPAQMPAPLQAVGGVPMQADPAIQALADEQAIQEATRQTATAKAAQVTAMRQAEEETKKAEAVAAQDAQDESKIKKDLENDAPSLGSQIGQAIAIMVGAYSQGLTGAKENPGLAAIEKRAEQLAAARKYNDEQKLKLAEMLYKQAQQQIEQKKATIDSMIGLKKLEQADQEIALKIEELNQKRQQRAVAGKTTFTREELGLLSPEERNKLNLVRIPGGKFASVIGADPKEVVKTNVDTDSALNTAGQLMQEIEYFGNNPVKKLASRERIGKAQGLAKALTGQLRLPYMGPGALTDQEREVLESISGDPTVLFSLASANKAKLQTIVEKVKHYRRSYLRNSGIDLPPSQNEVNVEKMLQAAPGLTRDEAVNALVRAGKWQNEE